MAKDERKIHRQVVFGPAELDAGQYDQTTFDPDQEDELEEFLDEREKNLEDGDGRPGKDEILERLERLGHISGFGYVNAEDVERQEPDHQANLRAQRTPPETSSEEPDADKRPRVSKAAKRPAAKKGAKAKKPTPREGVSRVKRVDDEKDKEGQGE